MSEFDEIQQSLHPFSMGHQQGQVNSGKGHHEDEVPKYNTNSDFAGTGPHEEEHKEGGGSSTRVSGPVAARSRSKKVMIKTAHQSERHRESERTVAAQMRKPSLPTKEGQSAAPAAAGQNKTPCVKRSTKKRELPAWQ